MFNCLRCVQVHVIFTLTYNANIQRYLSLLKQLKYNLLSKTLLKECNRSHNHTEALITKMILEIKDPSPKRLLS